MKFDISSPRTTGGLAIGAGFLAIGLCSCIWRLEAARGAALNSYHELAICRSDLADLTGWESQSGTRGAVGSGDETQDRRLRAAASASGLANQLLSVEAGKSVLSTDSQSATLPVYVRLGAVTLKQLFDFGFTLIADDPTVRFKSIELSAPASSDKLDGNTPANNTLESWTADLTLEYWSPVDTGKPVLR